MHPTGKVYLVGAGPGDPGLLTVKALELLRSADVVVYDRLVSTGILDLIPEGVMRTSVGKAAGHHCVPQDQINQLLVDLCLQESADPRTIVRLKGGDPFIFGRGSEEALFLREHGIPFEVVPGVTAAAACSAYAGVPLTHRGLSHGVRFVTGHFLENRRLKLDWRSLADPDSTIVIYMGLSSLGRICTELVNHGLEPERDRRGVPRRGNPGAGIRRLLCSRYRRSCQRGGFHLQLLTPDRDPNSGTVYLSPHGVK